MQVNQYQDELNATSLFFRGYANNGFNNGTTTHLGDESMEMDVEDMDVEIVDASSFALRPSANLPGWFLCYVI